MSKMVMVVVFNITFNNISVILWWSVLLVEETGVSRENHRPAASHRQIPNNVASGTPRHERVIGTDCTGTIKITMSQMSKY